MYTMMDLESQKMFNEVTSKDINDLTKEDIAYLKSRRLYLTPAQRLAYQTVELNLFTKKSEEKVVLDQTPIFIEPEIVVEDAEPEAEPVEDKPVKK